MGNDDVIIRLNEDALNALFPEGTDARVQLQNAVLSKAAKQYVKGMVVGDFEKKLQQIAREISIDTNVRAAVLREFGYKWNDPVKAIDNSDVVKCVQRKIMDEIDTHLTHLIDTKINEAISEYSKTLESRVISAVKAAIHKREVEIVSGRIKKAVDDVVANLQSHQQGE